MKRTKSNKLFKESENYFPGGVNSPVRAFKAVEGSPLFMVKGNGSRIWDVDGNEFIDYCCSWGPLILGHNNGAVRKAVTETMKSGMGFGTPTVQENELAKLILNNNKYIQKLRFVSSGTEAVMSAIRIARGYTKRDKIIKFEGCYHGHADSLLAKAGSGLATLGTSSSAGVPKPFTKETIVLPLNDEKAVEAAFKKYKKDIACIIIEPVPANNGLLIQDKKYLKFLRKICTENNSLLIFDEVISGFRIGFEGAAGYYKIKPDIATYGKIIGGGLPVGAYGASNKIMSSISPLGDVYQAGTLSGNPVAMSAGIAQLTECLKKNFYEDLNSKTDEFVRDIDAYMKENKYKATITSIGSIWWISFSNKFPIRSASDIKASTMEKFKVFFTSMLNKGIYTGPSGYEVGFMSSAHTKADLNKTKTAICESLDLVFK